MQLQYVSMRSRTLLLFVLIESTALVAGSLFAQEPPQFRVTLLGTGSPAPKMDRFGPSALVEAGHTAFLFDTGRGAIQRLTQVSKQYKDIRAVFLTHLQCVCAHYLRKCVFKNPLLLARLGQRRPDPEYRGQQGGRTEVRCS